MHSATAGNGRKSHIRNITSVVNVGILLMVAVTNSSSTPSVLIYRISLLKHLEMVFTLMIISA